MVESDITCNYSDKVYVRKGALQNHIKSKHKDESRQAEDQDQNQLFQRLDIPEELDKFPGGDEELILAAEAAEISEAG